MTLQQKLEKCLALQDEFNRIIDPSWKHAGFPWNRAMWIEAGEALDHYGYKWWKQQDTDMEQVKLELVDIFHFLLSGLLTEYDTNEQVARLLCGVSSRRSAKRERLPESIEYFVNSCTSVVDSYSMMARAFGVMVVDAGYDIELLADEYIYKNTLNKFRQDNGDKTGKYPRIWNGKEDNVVLVEIVAAGNKDYDSIYKELLRRYSELNQLQ